MIKTRCRDRRRRAMVILGGMVRRGEKLEDYEACCWFEDVCGFDMPPEWPELRLFWEMANKNQSNDTSTDQIDELTGNLKPVSNQEPIPATDENLEEIVKRLPWEQGQEGDRND